MVKDPDVAFVLSWLFGLAGADRMYIGQTGIGIVKALTLGGLGVWWIVDWFLIKNAARQVNALARG